MTAPAATQAPATTKRVVQLGLFGRDRAHRAHRATKPSAPASSISPTSLMTDIPLLAPLTERKGRGRPTERPVGMPRTTWLYWCRWKELHQPSAEAVSAALAEFLAVHQAARAKLARHRLSEASIDQPRQEWRTIRAWKDLTAAEEREWRRRIYHKATDGTYRLTLRGLQRLEVVR